MIRSFLDKKPVLHPEARAADSAALVGDVRLDSRSSVWYGAVLRGDEGSIRVGEGSNIQDQAVLHSDPGFPALVGRDVTVGHGAILHGCTVEDGCLIGAGSLVAAGALVTQGAVIPPGSLVMGSPARVVRPLTPEEAASLPASARTYRALAAAQLPAAHSQEVSP